MTSHFTSLMGLYNSNFVGYSILLLILYYILLTRFSATYW